MYNTVMIAGILSLWMDQNHPDLYFSAWPKGENTKTYCLISTSRINSCPHTFKELTTVLVEIDFHHTSELVHTIYTEVGYQHIRQAHAASPKYFEILDQCIKDACERRTQLLKKYEPHN